MRKIFSVLAILLFAVTMYTGVAYGHDEQVWEKLSNRSDVKITSKDGLRTARFSSGVIISENGVSMDNSGHGAVLCIWEIYTEIKNVAELCNLVPDERTREDLNYTVNKLNDFIVENSLSPVTKETLELKIKNKLEKLKKRTDIGTPEKLEKFCQSDDIPNMLEYVRKKPSEEFRKEIDKVVSVPRPPVLNPCL